MKTLVCVITLSMFCLTVASDTTDSPENDRAAWQPAIQAVFEQLDTLELFAAATRFGGLTVKVPRELQALPLRMVEAADELRGRGIEIHVTELEFRDLNFIYEKTPQWLDGRPSVPVAIEFGRLSFSAEANTRLGAAPLGATFEDGLLPVDFLPMRDKGFDLALIPETRQDETRLDNVRLQVVGPVVTRIANRFFTDRVAQLILEHGVGQTLQLGQSDLITGDAALRLLDIRPDSRSGRAVETLVDGLLR